MSLMRTMVEATPSLRWHVGRLMTRGLYSRALRSCGTGTVIVRPLILRGTENISIGRDCAIYEDSWLQAEEGGQLVIEDGVYIGHGTHLHAVSDVTIGARSMLADGVLINSGAHAAHDFGRTEARGPIAIGSDCFVGQRAVVLGGVSIGAGATVGAGAVVTKDVPAGATVAGVPAKVLKSPGTEPLRSPRRSEEIDS